MTVNPNLLSEVREAYERRERKRLVQRSLKWIVGASIACLLGVVAVRVFG